SSMEFTNLYYSFLFFFFFSSRRRHTRLQGDWSSDVCSSDLYRQGWRAIPRWPGRKLRANGRCCLWAEAGRGRPRERAGCRSGGRSEERRVGKEGRERGSECDTKDDMYGLWKRFTKSSNVIKK